MSSENPSQLRVIEVNEDEQAIIRVRTKHHITIVFDKSIWDMFEKEGIVYTRQVFEEAQDGYQEESEANVETQKLVEPLNTYDQEEWERSQFYNLDFDKTNENHENDLQSRELLGLEKHIDTGTAEICGDSDSEFSKEGEEIERALEDLEEEKKWRDWYREHGDTQLEYTQIV